MSNTPLQLSGRWPLAAVILATLTATATAGSFMRGCAARDMQVLMLIEDRESTRAVSADQLRDAMLLIMHARTCANQTSALPQAAICRSTAAFTVCSATIFISEISRSGRF